MIVITMLDGLAAIIEGTSLAAQIVDGRSLQIVVCADFSAVNDIFSAVCARGPDLRSASQGTTPAPKLRR